jgi:hypothetical protein
MQQLQSNMFCVSFVSMISSFYIQNDDKDKVWHVLAAHSQHWPAFVTNPFCLFIHGQVKNSVRLDPSLSFNWDTIRRMSLADCIADGLKWNHRIPSNTKRVKISLMAFASQQSLFQ